MVDFIKLFTNHLEIRELSWLDFEVSVNSRTGELRSYQEAKWKNLVLKSFNHGRLEISGSIHKFMNDGDHNYNQFTVDQLQDTINEICKNLRINSLDCYLVNIEFGLNLPCKNTQRVLKSLISHRNQPFDSLRNGYYRQCYKDEQIIKCYNKAKQYKQKEGILRFELKYITSRRIDRFGINTLEDLLSHGWEVKVFEELEKKWIEILFVDAFQLSEESMHLTSSDYWCSLTKEQRKRRYRSYQGKYGVALQNEILELIKECHQYILQV